MSSCGTAPKTRRRKLALHPAGYGFADSYGHDGEDTAYEIDIVSVAQGGRLDLHIAFNLIDKILYVTDNNSNMSIRAGFLLVRKEQDCQGSRNPDPRDYEKRRSSKISCLGCLDQAEDGDGERYWDDGLADDHDKGEYLRSAIIISLD